MSERFNKTLIEAGRREWGGPIPSEVMELAQRAALEMRRVLQPHVKDPNILYLAEMAAADAAVRMACEVLCRERTGDYHEDWDEGFGSVSRWETNGRG